jgi:hypothetical protein
VHPLQETVTTITVDGDTPHSKISREAQPMPILMSALFALAVFGIIGVGLTAAVVLEAKKANSADQSRPDETSINKPAA